MLCTTACPSTPTRIPGLNEAPQVPHAMGAAHPRDNGFNKTAGPDPAILFVSVLLEG